MNLSDLKAFVALAEMGSINRAALRLGLTQPATTRRLQNFEASVGGAPLLDRSVKPPVLTPAGRQALAHCRRVLNAVADLEACASDGHEPSGDLRIGVSPGLAETVLSSPLDELRRRFRNLQLLVTSQWTTPLISAVGNGELDCAIVLLIDHRKLPAGIVGTSIGIEALSVVGARDVNYPTPKRSHLRLDDVSQYGWVLNPAGCGYREALLRACDRAKASCKIVADVLGYDLQLSLIVRGAGLGLIPRKLIDKSPLRKRLRVLKVADFAPEARILMLRSASLGRLNRAVDFLQERVASSPKDVA